MAMMESCLIIAIDDAKQSRDIMTADIPNTFMKTDIKQMPNGKKYNKNQRNIC